MSQVQNRAHHQAFLVTPSIAVPWYTAVLDDRMRFDSVCLTMKLYVETNVIDYECKYLQVNTLHTHSNTKAPCRSQRPEFEALVLLCCCCTAAVTAVCTVAARLLMKSRGVVGVLYIVLPPAQHPINCTSLAILCDSRVRSSSYVDRKHDTHARTQIYRVRGRHKRKSLMHECCCTVAATK